MLLFGTVVICRLRILLALPLGYRISVYPLIVVKAVDGGRPGVAGGGVKDNQVPAVGPGGQKYSTKFSCGVVAGGGCYSG